VLDRRRGGQGWVLFRARLAKLYVGIIIWAATGRAEAIHIVAHVVIAKLANLGGLLAGESVSGAGSEDEPDNHRRRAENLDLRDQTPQHREDMSLPHRRR
jgi:hypothetical protein